MNLQIATQLIMMFNMIFNNHDENCYPVNKFDNVATTSGNFEKIKYFGHATS